MGGPRPVEKRGVGRDQRALNSRTTSAASFMSLPFASSYAIAVSGAASVRIVAMRVPVARRSLR